MEVKKIHEEQLAEKELKDKTINLALDIVKLISQSDDKKSIKIPHIDTESGNSGYIEETATLIDTGNFILELGYTYNADQPGFVSILYKQPVCSGATGHVVAEKIFLFPSSGKAKRTVVYSDKKRGLFEKQNTLKIYDIDKMAELISNSKTIAYSDFEDFRHPFLKEDITTAKRSGGFLLKLARFFELTDK